MLWFTGLSGAGKSTIANLVDKNLHALRRHTYLLDGDNVRHGLNKDLGFTAADRVENIRRIGEVAKLLVDAGLIVSTAFISPFRAERGWRAPLIAEGEFIEIYVDTPLEVAEQRDPKGLYKKARRGELEELHRHRFAVRDPRKPGDHHRHDVATPEQAAEMVVTRRGERGVLHEARGGTTRSTATLTGCAPLQQLRLAGCRGESAATRVTGVKRDIALLERVAAPRRRTTS